MQMQQALLTPTWRPWIRKTRRHLRDLMFTHSRHCRSSQRLTSQVCVRHADKPFALLTYHQRHVRRAAPPCWEAGALWHK